ncbi:related to sorbitol dehydrogenase [Pseudozyma flocculosa]|uniref:Related to sorbitol dehydrogenase n=1 Tax=Pseudozyma flocculosa TaxID=84751 RepID=A0A5C3FAE6_9BASI|nr:related to sorbitol dehydrogenase [Pseudozyma flocculosa]
MAPTALSTPTPAQPSTSAIPAKANNTMTTNLSAVLHGPKDLRVVSRPIEAPAPTEVQIRVRCTGLCGSDLHYYIHGRNGDFALQHPMCLGHESGGEIVALGADVAASQALSIGDRVAIEAGRMCGACQKCKEGRYNLCKNMRFASSAKTFPHLDGTLQRFMNWPAALVHRLPENVSYTSAALCEPLSVVLQGIRRSNLQAGQSVLVLGAGAVGLLACAAAKASGASYVAAADIDEGRLAFARANGWVDGTFLIPRAAPPAAADADTPTDARARRAAEDAASVAAAKSGASVLLETLSSPSSTAATAGQDGGYAVNAAPLDLSTDGFDLTFECTGVPSCVSLSIFTTRAGGKTILIGMGNPIQTLPIGAAALREVDIVGVFRYANTYPVALGLLAGGGLRAVGGGVHASGSTVDGATEGHGVGRKMGGIENLVSHSFPLEQSVEAFETLARGKGAEGRGVVKVFVVDNEP